MAVARLASVSAPDQAAPLWQRAALSTDAHIRERDAPAAQSALAEAVDVGIQVEGEEEALSPFALLLSLQLFTYWMAVKRGCNPDLAHRDDARHAKATGHFDM